MKNFTSIAVESEKARVREREWEWPRISEKKGQNTPNCAYIKPCNFAPRSISKNSKRKSNELCSMNALLLSIQAKVDGGSIDRHG